MNISKKKMMKKTIINFDYDKFYRYLDKKV